jgi:glycine/D-amino acid oxidase-like deaminating enzyme
MWTPENSFRDAEPAVYWTSQRRPVPDQPELTGNTIADLAIIGGGFTGLWAAIEAKRRDPDRDVVLLEMQSIAFGASGRNGGFIDPSLTHGLENALSRYSQPEVRKLEAIGKRNFAEIESFIRENAIDCDFQKHGVIWGATAPYMLDYIPDVVETHRAWGHDAIALDAGEIRAQVASPFYLGGVWVRDEGGLVDPARLAWGLLRVAIDLGVRVHEHTRVVDVVDAGNRVVVRTGRGSITAECVVHATSAYPGAMKRARRYIAPVYDYVLVSEPLTEAQHAAIGWSERFGLTDGDNQFVYFRMTEDRRILYGGWDAVYHFGGKVHPSLDVRGESFAFLADRFFKTFPQLEGLRFSYKWGGAIDTCSRFAVFFDSSHGGKVVLAAGYTGLGVGASRFGACTALDLVDGIDSERTELELVLKRPIPFPPEPLRSGVIRFTQRAIAEADRNHGRRGRWLKLLDRFGVGFDS